MARGHARATRASTLLRGLGALLAGLVAGCGAGTAAILAGSDDGGNGGAAPSVTFQVVNPKVSPAPLRLEASAGLVAEFFLARPERDEVALQGLSGPGVSGNRVELPAGSTVLTWTFAADLGGTGFVEDVTLVARALGGAPIAGGSLRLGLGNDAPEVLSVVPVPTDPLDPTESAGNIEVEVELRDSSADVVTLLVDWRRASEPEDVWHAATTIALPGGIETSPDGVTLSFVWNTNVDLARGEDDVLLRVRGDDRTLDLDEQPIGISAPRVSALVHVDNNAEPVLQLLNDFFVLNPDGRRGIPVALRVADEEEDPVDVILQWRREGEEFVPLELAELDAILNDPERRRAHQICAIYEPRRRVPIDPVDAATVRVPALAAGELEITPGDELSLYRSVSATADFPNFHDLSATWASNPLEQPAAIESVGDGRTALVLDRQGTTASSVKHIDLLTGELLWQVGLPRLTAITIEANGGAALAVGESNPWQLWRIELASGESELVAAGAGTGVSSVASLDARRTVIVDGGALRLVDLADPSGLHPTISAAQFVDDVERDPRDPQRLFFSGSGVLYTLDLRTSAVETVHVGVFDFALEERGLRVFSGEFTFDLGLADAELVRVSFDGSAHSAATGPEGLRLLLRGRSVLASGGLEQRRTVAGVDLDRGLITVQPPFAPEPRPVQAVSVRRARIPTSPSDGSLTSFLWDSSEVVPAGHVLLRGFARDSEPGLVVETATSKRVRDPLDLEPQILASLGREIAIADVDGDGALDVVNADGLGGVALYLQADRGSFEPVATTLSGAGSAWDVVAADLDGDGDVDVAASEFGSDTLAVFEQEHPLAFAPSIILQDSGGLRRPRSLVTADLDVDGDLDLAALSQTSQILSVFFQEGGGSFAEPALRLETLSAGNRMLEAADLDGDGDADLLCPGPQLWIQDSPGAFSSRSIGGSFSGFVTAGDLDADGDVDLASFTFTNQVELLSQTASGAYDLVLLEPDPTLLESLNKIGTADLDGDGRLDLFAGGESGVLAFMQTASGTLSPRARRLGPEEAPFLAFGDLDADGNLDMVSAGVELAVHFQSRPAGFHLSPPDFPVPVPLGSLESIEDLDGDGARDLLFVASAGGALLVHLQTSPGRFEQEPRVSEVDAVGGPTTADLDGDGDLDLISIGGLGEILVHLQTSRGRFETLPETLGGPGITDGATYLQAVDVDGDGALDLATSNQASLTIFLQVGPRSFGPDPIVLGGAGLTEGPGPLAAADLLDDDGDIDLACANAANQTVTIFRQISPPGVFDPEPLVLPGDGLSNSIALDLDSDGRADLVVGASAYFSEGGGQFVRASFPGVPAGDLDGDGDVDLFSGGTIYLQRSRRFDATTDLGSSIVAAADLDGDGDLDVLTSAGIHFQSTNGAFAPKPFPLGTAAPIVLVVDLDGDGELDLVRGDSSVQWGGR